MNDMNEEYDDAGCFQSICVFLYIVYCMDPDLDTCG